MEGPASINESIFDAMVTVDQYASAYAGQQAAKIAVTYFTSMKNKLDKVIGEYAEGATKERFTAMRSHVMQTALSMAAVAQMDAETAGGYLAAALAGKTADALNSAMPWLAVTDRPDPSQIIAAATKTPLTQDGWLVHDRFKSFGEAQGKLIAGRIQAGYLFGETTDQIKAKIIGTPKYGFTDGDLESSKKAVLKLVRTTLQHYATEARFQMMDTQFGEVLKGYEWVATLDDRTCPVCGPLDGRLYPLDKPAPRPPIHYNCRCTVVPVAKSWEELGAKGQAEASASARASMDGQVAAPITWKDWITQKEATEPGFAKPILGKHYEPWKKGEYALGAYDPAAVGMTLEELSKHVGIDSAAIKAAQAAKEAAQAAEEIKAIVAAQAAEQAAVLATIANNAAKAAAAAQEAAAKAAPAAKLRAAGVVRPAATKAAVAADNGVTSAAEFGKGLKPTGDKLGGSTGAQMYQDASGQKWIVKTYGGRVEQAQNEFIASNLYKTFGIRVPEVRMVEVNGQLGIASKYLGNSYKQLGTQPLATAQKSVQIKSGFAVDAYLANWDVAGLQMDNILVKLAGNKMFNDAVRIDTGGALLFRAQGSPKGAAFGRVIKEFDSLRDPSINPNTAKLFANLGKREIVDQINLMLKVPHTEVRSVIIRSGLAQDLAQGLDKILYERREYLNEYRLKLLKEMREEKKAPAPAALYTAVPEAQKYWGGFRTSYGDHPVDKTYGPKDKNAALAAVKEIFPRLSQAEQRALAHYTSTGYQSMNRAAHERGVGNADLESGIRKLPRYTGNLYRGMSDRNNIYRNFDKFTSGEWGTLHFTAYNSTAFRPGNSFWRDGNLRLIFLNNGNYATGMIEGRSSVNGEYEVLMDRNTAWRVAGWAEGRINKSAPSIRYLLLEEGPPSELPTKQSAPKRYRIQELMDYAATRAPVYERSNDWVPPNEEW